MIKELLYKWFGLSDKPCESCEVLRSMLDESNRERKELLHRLLDKDKPEPLVQEKEIMEPIQPKFVPWRIRQQMLETEDAKRAQIMRDRQVEIARLESELGVSQPTEEVN